MVTNDEHHKQHLNCLHINCLQIAIPCRPQKTFTIYVYDVPDEVPEEDVRHALYKFTSIVEVIRLHFSGSPREGNGTYMH